MKPRSVIVIGAGIGGITTVIYLTGHELKVTVLDPVDANGDGLGNGAEISNQ